ncbi:hypothetical protein L202_04749 [Cryptococcus amylolentus CBS 6039]|uniref:Uncharacterized protein n=2 Tax=Cryptococcus amylolentus TaxID=104669 RepID=A0A1E3HQ67_9TREE|nr:hypothetical protein L202_04749 [Cryptococcus amylolentus CBS 6039]ODN77581.1 hypothetical protein L202_04749 [Cryptococcus amylolentus CBS 6039]ODO05616.1 hypothetical protein I350_04675 [Cryptococcus amylolentus CBS 6273]
MSTAVHESAVDLDKRAQKLASARKKLHTYRASRSSADSHPSHTRQPSPHKMPLTTEASTNTPAMPQHKREGSKGQEKDFEEPKMLKARHRRSDSQAHRRQRSSISLSTSGQGLSRPSVMGVFESPKEQEGPSSLISEEGQGGHDFGYEEAAARLSSFSFGSKPMPARGGSFPPKRRSHSRQPSAPLFDMAAAPLPSPTSPNRLSTPSSRPPSVLLTRPTPGLLPSPNSLAGPSRVGSPSSPPTPVRRRQHSHTRSNSISLPNLKLQNAQVRPTSLGVPISPGFSPLTSPVSPNGDIPGRPSRVGPLNGQRLKFEPSGRGAEAEKEREESRKQALEKLTGAPLEISRSRSPVVESPVNEISLPDLDDEDVESVASSARPLSGLGGSGSFSWSTQSSLSLPLSAGSSMSSPLAASPFSWASPTDERAFSDRPLSGIGFGLTSSLPAPVPIKEESLPSFGDFMSKQGKRPSMNRQLSALQEVDESEEDEDTELEDVKEEEEEEAQHSFWPSIIVPTLPTIHAQPAPVPASVVSPTGLRQLRLVSSVASSREASSPADSHRSFPIAHATSPPASISSALTHGPPSPTKSYGTIGRGRPKPVSMLQSEAEDTPKRTLPRKSTPGSGSRGSSISYKKDTSSSTGSADLGLTSPPAAIRPLGSPTKKTWGRPCPRPRGLAGDVGSGRVLNEVDEADEEYPFPRIPSGPSAPAQDKRLSIFSASSERVSSELSRESFEQSREQDRWRDVQLEMERENQQLRDDVEFWKGKSMGFEERYESERREGMVLRERVRKLGNRLSSISSLPTERQSFESSAHTAESRMVAEMREQLFQLTGKLEQERKAKELALAQLRMVMAPRNEKEVETEDAPELRCDRSESQRDSTPSIVTPDPDSRAPIFPAVTNPAHEQLSITSGAEKRLTPDLSTRFRGWGFPSGPQSTSSSTEGTQTSLAKKRESFFGLSNPLRRASSDDAPASRSGVDLPPFDIGLGTELGPDMHGQAKRVVSDPANPYSLSMPTIAPGKQSGGYVGFGLPQYPQPSVQARHHQEPEYGYGETTGVKKPLDFSRTCECCVGEVIEV